MGLERGLFNRAELLLGSDVMEAVVGTRAIVFGVGGVGSWCAECLVRSGVGKLTIVDSDRVCVTNINRQLMATIKTVGQVKVEVLKNRLMPRLQPCRRFTTRRQPTSLTSTSTTISSMPSTV